MKSKRRCDEVSLKYIGLRFPPFFPPQYPEEEKLLHPRPKAMGVEQQSTVFETGRNFRFLALAAGNGKHSEYAVKVPAASALPLTK